MDFTFKIRIQVHQRNLKVTSVLISAQFFRALCMRVYVCVLVSQKELYFASNLKGLVPYRLKFKWQGKYLKLLCSLNPFEVSGTTHLLPDISASGTIFNWLWCCFSSLGVQLFRLLLNLLCCVAPLRMQRYLEISLGFDVRRRRMKGSFAQTCKGRSQSWTKEGTFGEGNCSTVNWLH